MSQQSIQSLFDDAQDDGLSAAAAGILVNNLSFVTMQGAQGVEVDDLGGESVTLYVRVLDKSSSMGPYQQAVIDAANLQVKALLGAKGSEIMLMSTWTFSYDSELLHSYLPLDEVILLDNQNYSPSGMTKLNDTVLDAITGAVAYAQTLRASGIRVKIVIIIVSDGEDNQSSHSIGQVRTVIEDLFAQEIYTVSMVFLGSNGRSVANSMGIPDGNLLEVQASESSIRHAFNEMSKSVIRASQTVIGQGNSTSFFS